MSAAVPKFIFQESLYGVHDFVHRIWTPIRYPVGLAGGGFHRSGEKQSLAKIIDVTHRTEIFAVADNRSFAIPDHTKKERLARGLVGPIEPGRANDDSFKRIAAQPGSLLSIVDAHFHPHLGTTIVQIRSVG